MVVTVLMAYLAFSIYFCKKNNVPMAGKYFTLLLYINMLFHVIIFGVVFPYSWVFPEGLVSYNVGWGIYFVGVFLIITGILGNGLRSKKK